MRDDYRIRRNNQRLSRALPTLLGRLLLRPLSTFRRDKADSMIDKENLSWNALKRKGNVARYEGVKKNRRKNSRAEV